MFIIPSNNAGASIGAGLGQGLGSGLSALAEMKLGQLHRAQQQNEWAQGYKAMIPGISDAQAHQLAQADPKVQVAYIKQMLQGPERQQFNETLQNIFGAEEPTQEAYGLQQEPTGLVQKQQLPQLSPLTSKPTESIFEEGMIPGSGLKMNKLYPQETEEPYRKIPEKIEVAPVKEKGSFKINPRLPIEKQVKLAELKMKMDKHLSVEKEKLFKKNDPLIKQLSEENESSRNSDMRLGAIERLTKEGKISDFGRFNAMIEGIHIPFVGKLDFTPWMNADEQTVDKLSKDFLRDISKIFKGRVLQSEIENFMKTVPSLLQSDEGRLKVIHNIKLFNKAAKIKYDAMRDILKENKMVPPRYLEMEIEERTKKQMQEIEKKFVEGNDKEIKEAAELARKRQMAQPKGFIKGALNMVTNPPRNLSELGTMLDSLGGRMYTPKV